jgi:hypothetical protein
MSRTYLRPGLRASELKELQEGRIVLIDPTVEDVVDALKTVQNRCRKNIIRPEVVRDFATRTLAADSPDGWLGDWICPPRSRYGEEGTCLQIVHLVGGPTACYVERMPLHAGEATAPRVRAIGHRVRSPSEWLAQVTTVFWTHLSDEELQRQEEWTTGEVLWRYAVRRGANAKRVRTLRRNQIEKLLKQRDVRPVFTAELQDALTSVANELEAEGASIISWPEFKRRWRSVSARYKIELAALWGGHSLNIVDLRFAKVVSELDLSLGIWLGAQRIFNTAQLVFRITCGAAHRRLADGDQEDRRLSDIMQRLATHEGHPGTPNMVGWLRVHIDDDNRLCFVDEIQSNVIEFLSSEAEAGSSAARELAKQLGPWRFHGFATVKHWAGALDYQVGIHSRETAQAKPGMTNSERKWNTYYGSVIKRFGLIEANIPGYPGPIFTSTRGD